MADKETWDDPAWPPGTVRLEVLKPSEDASSTSRGFKIVLQPRPTSDPNDPLNWPKWRKNLNFSLSVLYAMLVYAQINATTPTWGPMSLELNFSVETLNDTYAIGCATLALGAFMLIPFALKYGLRPIYILSSAGQMAVMIWAARTQTAGDWWGVNALQCWLGSLGECLVQMTVADLFFIHQRGLKNSIYVWVSNVGGFLAVVAAGFITESQGWRWVWWWCTILFSVELLMFIFGFEESKFDVTKTTQGRAPVSNHHGLSSSTGEKDKAPDKSPERYGQQQDTLADEVAEVHIDHDIPRKTYRQVLLTTNTTKGPWQLFARHAYQPFQICFTIPGVAYISSVYAVLLAWSTCMSAALSTYMIVPPYNFTASQIGLMNIAPFIGSTIGSVICGPLSDWLILRLARRNGGIYEPEMRLWVFMPFIPFQVAGAFWFGYALQDGQSWVNVALAFGICNFGTAPISSVALTYLTDAYNEVCQPPTRILTRT